MPETMGNKEIFDGMPHCPRCQSKMITTLSLVLPTENTVTSHLYSYACENCMSGLRVLSYYDHKDKTVRDADCKLDKYLQAKMLSFISNCSDTRERVEA